MLKNEIAEFLLKIDEHINKHFSSKDNKEIFKLNIIGKSALLLSGLTDSSGTSDIDSLKIESEISSPQQTKITSSLEQEFGKSRIKVHGYYIEFVSSSIVLLPSNSKWLDFGKSFKTIEVQFLEAHFNIASKLFSAFTNPPRNRDKQDIVAALDQKLVDFQKTITIADRIFDEYSMDARKSRFKQVFEYIRNELMAKYGKVKLKYVHDEDIE
jgi:hypothetical protein